MQEKQPYYFLSAGYTGDAPAWTRKPFMTKEKVLKWIRMMNPCLYSSVEIYCEDTLKTIIYVKSDSDEFIETNLRELLFGTQYSATGKSYESTKEYFINLNEKQK